MEAGNSGVITTWGEPLFGPLPLQLIGNATRHRHTVCYNILSKLHSLSQQLPAVHSGLRLSHPPTRGVSTSQGAVHSILDRGEVEKGHHRWPAIGYLHLLPRTPSPYGTLCPGRACPNLPFLICTQFGSIARRPN
jgi:hypothetical protein